MQKYLAIGQGVKILDQKNRGGGGGSTKCVQLAFATQSKITGLSVPQTHARSVGVSVKILHIISKMSGKLN